MEIPGVRGHRSKRLLGGFKVLRANVAEVAVAAGWIVKGINVVGDILRRQRALSQQLAFRLMLGSRWFERQKRRHPSLPRCVP